MKLILLLTCFSIAALAQKNPTVEIGNNPSAGGYFSNGPVKIYYEVYGTGKPLVIIHGNGGSIRGRVEFIQEFSKKYKVIMMDNRCHGKTDCPAAHLTYEQIAGDLNALLTHLKVDSTFMWGHSDGAIIGLIMAMKYPDKVKKLLASSANLRPDTTAIDPAIFPLLDKMRPQYMKDSIQSKRFQLLVSEPHIPAKNLGAIKADVLIMAGDRDIIRTEHTLEIFNNIPGAFLCILPGTTHGVYQDRNKWFKEILYDFFDNPQQRLTTVELMKKSMK
ncbi:MAG TPA: alpha/beta hydrolase [Cyclobacteriaceae bacterium]|nr:alpha/beta hydrolase [Cyclobacteriaceae bacterium]